jgi:hypothetical protein
MYNPEYYVGAYRNESTAGRWKTTKFTEDLIPTTAADDDGMNQQHEPER